MSQGAPHPRMHGLTHVPGGPDPIPGLGGEAGLSPFYDAVADLAPTANLLGYWRLGDGASPFADTSGNPGGPNDLVKTSTGTAMTDSVTGALPVADDDGAVQFNAVSGVAGDYLSATDSLFDGNSSVRTVAFWVKPAGSYTSAQYMVATMDFSNGGWGVGMSLASRQVFLHRRDSGGNVVAYGPSLPNAWSFVSIDFDTGGVKMYVNGSPVFADSVTQGIHNNTALHVGRRAGGTPDSFQGAIDELSLWGTRLTASEHALLAASGGLAQEEGVKNVIAVAGAYTASADEVVLATGTITITLPTAVGARGQEVTVKNVGSGTVTVARPSGEQIDGAASNVSLTVSKSARAFVSDGAGWQITAAYL